VIPLDFSVNRAGGGLLWSQVLFVSGLDGRLLHALDIYWEEDDTIPVAAMEYYPVQVALRRETVLVLKRSELYVIQSRSTGG
jgi:hypothetical protein